MGHHNVFCAITHVSIRGGDRVVAVWAKPRKFQDQFSGLQPCSIFYRGEYDSYGRIDLDKDQKYTELVTEEMLDNPTMFILESVYDELDAFASDKFGDGINSGSAYDTCDLDSFCLKLVGFEKQEMKSSDSRYHTIYKHPSEPSKEVWSDGTWIMIKEGEKIHQSIYSWKDFEKHFPNVDYSPLHNNTNEYLKITKDYQEYKKDTEWFGEVGKEVRPYFVDTLCERNLMSSEMVPYLEYKEFRKLVGKVHRVYWFMYANNLKFGYRFHGGPQDGNFEATQKLHELMGNAIKRKIEEESEWDD